MDAKPHTWVSELESTYHKAIPFACKQVNLDYCPPKFRLNKKNNMNFFYLLPPNTAWVYKQIAETAPASSAGTDYH